MKSNSFTDKGVEVVVDNSFLAHEVKSFIDKGGNNY